jgi:hypothetical protein
MATVARTSDLCCNQMVYLTHCILAKCDGCKQRTSTTYRSVAIRNKERLHMRTAVALVRPPVFYLRLPFAQPLVNPFDYPRYSSPDVRLPYAGAFA